MKDIPIDMLMRALEQLKSSGAKNVSFQIHSDHRFNLVADQCEEFSIAAVNFRFDEGTNDWRGYQLLKALTAADYYGWKK